MVMLLFPLNPLAEINDGSPHCIPLCSFPRQSVGRSGCCTLRNSSQNVPHGASYLVTSGKQTTGTGDGVKVGGGTVGGSVAVAVGVDVELGVAVAVAVAVTLGVAVAVLVQVAVGDAVGVAVGCTVV